MNIVTQTGTQYLLPVKFLYILADKMTKKFNTELTDYSVQHPENTGPYADNLEIDALVVGAGFGMWLPLYLYVVS